MGEGRGWGRRHTGRENESGRFTQEGTCRVGACPGGSCERSLILLLGPASLPFLVGSGCNQLLSLCASLCVCVWKERRTDRDRGGERMKTRQSKRPRASGSVI